MAAIEGTAGSGSVPRTTPANIALVSLAVVPISLGYLHATTPASAVDPVRQTISDYVAVPYGAALLALASAAAIIAVAALCRAIIGVPGTAAVQLLLLSWCLVVAVGAVFPTNVPGTPPDLSAVLHRYSGAWQFASLPLAGLLLAARTRPLPEWRRPSVWIRRMALAVGVLSAAFLASHIPIVFFGHSSDYAPLGLVERVAFLLEIALLAVIAVAVRRAARVRSAAR